MVLKGHYLQKKTGGEVDIFFCYRKKSFAAEKVRLREWYSLLLEKKLFSYKKNQIATFKFIFVIENTNFPENCNLILLCILFLQPFILLVFYFHLFIFLFSFVFSRKNIPLKKLKRCKLFYFQPRRGFIHLFHSKEWYYT